MNKMLKLWFYIMVKNTIEQCSIKTSNGGNLRILMSYFKYSLLPYHVKLKKRN